MNILGRFIGAEATVVHRFADCPQACGGVRRISGGEADNLPQCERCGERLSATLFPQRAVDGECRLCGAIAPLTFEHVPTRASFNADTVHSRPGDEWFAEPMIGPIPGGRPQQRGMGGYTLCRACNETTGRLYGVAYKTFAYTLHDVVQSLDVEALDRLQEVPIAHVQLEAVPVGKFIRQVLSTLCSVSGGELRRRAPQITDIVLRGRTAALPDNVKIRMALAPQRTVGRVIGGTEVTTKATGKSALLAEFVHYPMSFLLVLEGDEARTLRGEDITVLTTLPATATATLDLRLPLAFCHTMIPGDYRSRGEILSGAAA
jgi:hypothetical protein